jgi:hypothetical protein
MNGTKRSLPGQLTFSFYGPEQSVADDLPLCMSCGGQTKLIPGSKPPKVSCTRCRTERFMASPLNNRRAG